jgi:hypothetical protein
MNRNSLLAAAVLAASLAGSVAPARAAAPIDRRLDHQRQLITQYRRTGALSAHEVRRLSLREDQIAFRAQRARQDGRLTGAERARLESELNRQHRTILRLARNG